VEKKGQKEYFGERTMDCSTGEGGRVKMMRIGMIENSDAGVNNTGIKKEKEKKATQ
jgi:hypothetical protein